MAVIPEIGGEPARMRWKGNVRTNFAILIGVRATANRQIWVKSRRRLIAAESKPCDGVRHDLRTLVHPCHAVAARNKEASDSEFVDVQMRTWSASARSNAPVPGPVLLGNHSDISHRTIDLGKAEEVRLVA